MRGYLSRRTPYVGDVQKDIVSPSRISSGIIRGFLQSENFEAGVSGWKIDRSGVIQALQINIAGASTIAGWSIDSTRIFKSNAVLSSDGYVAFGSTPPTSYGNNIGAWLGTDGSLAKMSLYNNANNFLQWDGSKLLFKTVNTELESDGSLTVSNLTANSGNIAGDLIIGGDNNVQIKGTDSRIIISDGANDRVLIGEF